MPSKLPPAWAAFAVRSPGQRWAALGLLAAVAWVHVALLWPGSARLPARQAARAAWPVVQVRQMAAEVALQGPSQMPLPMPVKGPEQGPVQGPVQGKTAPVARPAPRTKAAGAPQGAAPNAASAPVLATPAPAAPARATPGTARTLPVYATALPPAMHLRFRTQRGEREGQADLSWLPDAQGYELRLQGDLPGRSGWQRISRGGFDAAGLAPQRYAEGARGREARAVNFERQSGRITFSGPGIEHELLPGAQDRLSWIIQLAGIAQAQPDALAPGRQIELFVAGTRGDAQVWRFEVLGTESHSPGDGTPAVPTVALRREPARPYDTRAEIWLDPARSYLPLRLRLSTVPGPDALEWWLLAMNPP